MSALLKGCPFCGKGEAEVGPPYRRQAICAECLARGPISDEPEAAWNHRAEGHTEEREKWFREGIEAAAKVAETAGPEHYARQHNGMTRQVSESEAFIARSIRALSPAPLSRGDDDYRTFGPWRDIASAPKDGTEVLVYVPRRGGATVHTSSNSTGTQWWSRGTGAVMPTHWLPLPDAPASAPTKDSDGDGGEG